MLFYVSVLPSHCRVSQQLCLICLRATYWEMFCGPAPGHPDRDWLQLLPFCCTFPLRTPGRRQGGWGWGSCLLLIWCQDTGCGNQGAPRHPSSQLGRGRQSSSAAFSSIIVADRLGTESCFLGACASAIH